MSQSELPTLNSFPLHDVNWRDANIDSLEQWHPCFREIHQDMEGLVNQFAEIMKRYKPILLEDANSSKDDLFNHLNEESNVWLLNKMQSTIEQIWSNQD